MATETKPEVRIGFKAGFGLKQYHDQPKSWLDGDKRKVSAEVATYLCKTFPRNFSKAR